MNALAKSLKDLAEDFVSSLPPEDSRAKSIRTQVLNYVSALNVQPPKEEDEGPVRVLDMRMPPPAGRTSVVKAVVRPADASGRLPLLPANRKLARMHAGFTLQEVASAAGTTLTTAKIYEEHRSSIRRNDKRKALDDVYRMFLEAT